MARPSEYNQEKVDLICDRLADGESLRSICRDSDMPSTGTVCRWLGQNKAFQEQYARARELQADALFDETLDIADDATNDWMQKQDGEGGVAFVLNGENIQRSRLRIETRKWLVGKLRPKKYGEKQVLEHSGPDGGSIDVVNRIERVIVDGPNAKD
jgi:hypothetical protein